MKKNLKDLLAGKLNPLELELLYKSYDIVGDIAVIRVPEALKKHVKTISNVIMRTHKRVKTVLRQTSPISGYLRLRELEWVAGERKTETIYKEHGCVFKVDLGKCYFSPRLSYERMRIARQVRPNETVVNMFAGVGCYSIVIAKYSEAKKVYSIDINPAAIDCMRENIRLNRVEGQIIPILGDAKRVVKERLRNAADRVLMPLPERGYDYLDCALSALKPVGGWIHYYDFEHTKKNVNPVEKVKEKVCGKLQKSGVDLDASFGRIVRTTGPNWFQVVLDIRVRVRRLLSEE